ncbi:acetate--CoA ligase family protein [Paraburkholderia bannensis]|uniref:acetate--CoA ligase family protein n=1 Tax=Paraburkholderia bannensis TaxID=765414 RepID=UPI002AC32F79|nr:acetate--CoA ligase family protein [Paraburkholderia bannensis]
MSTAPEHPAARQAIDRLFNPRSIALVGATERSIWSVAANDNLRRFDFKGAIHYVNPKGGTIFGAPAATSCAAVGEPIDAALLMVPEAKMIDVFADLEAAGVGGAVILSAGFAELGEAGAERQRAVAAAAKAAGIRILGPNCLGFANFVAGAPIWTTPLRRPMADARVAIVSQSGAIASQLEQFAYQQRVGVTHMISTGNEADITIADAIDYLARQPEPRAIALFLESVREPARFAAAVRAATAAGKPVVLLKVGTSEATARAAQAHTGSLVGDDRVFDALCRQLGLSRVHSLEELIVTADLFARLGPVEADGLALTAMSGGMCEIMTDQADAEGIAIPTLADGTLKRLREALPPFATPANPLDITGAAMLQPDLIPTALAALADDASVGALGFVFDAPLKDDARGFARSFIRHIGEGFKAAGKPCLMMSHTFSAVNGEAREMTDSAGVVYSGGGVRHCVSALGHLVAHHAWRRRTSGTVEPGTRATANGARPNGEREVLDYLAAANVPVIPASLARTADEAVTIAAALGTSVVLKIASPDIAHKTEVGGVALNLHGDAAVRDAFDTMIARVRQAAPEAQIDGVVIAPMRKGGVELFVGTMNDPQWGPAIAVGLGGIWVEALKDTSLRLLPIGEQDVLDMLAELRGAKLLDGFRGAPAADRLALARAIVAIGDAALALGPDLVSLEINPLLVDGARVEALDGLTEWEARA